MDLQTVLKYNKKYIFTFLLSNSYFSFYNIDDSSQKAYDELVKSGRWRNKMFNFLMC